MPLDYQTIFSELNSGGIDYLLAGGLAVNFHGIPRMTYDIDLLIALDPENILKVVSKLSEWEYRPRAPVNPTDLADETIRNQWILEKNMRAFSFYNEMEALAEIDLIIDFPLPYAELKARAKIFSIGRTEVPVVSIADLIAFKTATGRRQDLSDADHLRGILEVE